MPNTRRLANTKRVDLSSVADGWDDCYALVTKASVQEFADFSKLDAEKITNIEATAKAVEFVKPHLAGGKVMAFNDAGKMELVDITEDDLSADMDITALLFAAITGVAPDPKGSLATTEPSPTSDLPNPTTDSTQQ